MLDPLKRKLLDEAKAQLEEALKAMPVVNGRILTSDTDFATRLDQFLRFEPDDTLDHAPSALSGAKRAGVRVRISPTVAADYQARNVFPSLRPPAGESPGRYCVDHEVPRAVAQAVFDDATAQAARGGSPERRSLTLAYNALSRRTVRIFGSEMSRFDPGANGNDPGDFREQASVVDGLLRAISRMPSEGTRRRPGRGR